MRKFFNYTMAFLAAGIIATGFSACSSSDDTESGVEQQLGETEEAYLQKVLEAYTDKTVVPTYQSMAVNATTFYNDMKTLRDAVAAGTATQAMVDKACDSWKLTRADYEKSEAFLLGAASDYNVDPHIDTWPVDLQSLWSILMSPNELNKYIGGTDTENIAAASTDLGQSLAGFHSVEFLLFRDGAPRKVAVFNSGYDDYNDQANFTTVSTSDELKYAVTVAGDLMRAIYLLEVTWSGGTADHKALLEELENPTTMPSSSQTYGENMKNAGKAGSTYTSVKSAISALLVGDNGCVGICDEVGQTKMGKPYGLNSNADNATSDPSYIESPYSHNSLTDFYDNIESIKNVWYGSYDAANRSTYSLSNYFAKLNPDLGKKVEAAIVEAQTKINAIPKPFVVNYQRPEVLTAINACMALSDVLTEANEYVLQRNK